MKYSQIFIQKSEGGDREGRFCDRARNTCKVSRGMTVKRLQKLNTIYKVCTWYCA